MEKEEKRRLEEEFKQPWMPLEEQGVDERTIKPDFYVDRPSTPEFIPNPSGVDKQTQVEDHELFDFELEVEPILEVLIGKALEQGRIETLEEWEREELRKHKDNYETVRQAELTEVQRMEAAYNRRVEETRRRKLQQEAHSQLNIQTQQKLLARLISRGVLSHVKPSSVQLLEGAGVLRNLKDQDMHSIYIPHLFGVIEGHIHEQVKEEPILSEMLDGMIALIASEHRDSIVDEYKKRLKKIEKDEEKRAIEIADTRRKKEDCEALKEKTRLEKLKARIDELIIAKATQVEESMAGKITDVAIEDKEPHLFSPGGVLGEILLTVAKVHKIIAAANHEFKLTPEIIDGATKVICEAFFKNEIFIDVPIVHDHNFMENIPESELLQALSPDNIASPGLKYILERMDKFGLDKGLVNSILTGIVRVRTKRLEQQKELIPTIAIPEEKLRDMPEEEKVKEKEIVAKENEEIEKKNAEIKAKNEEIERENEAISQLQSKIRIVVNPEMLERGKICAVVKISPLPGPALIKAPTMSIDVLDVNSSKRGQKSQMSLVVNKHLAVTNVLDDLRLIISNKSNISSISSLRVITLN